MRSQTEQLPASRYQTVGIIAGLGAAAGATFYARLVAATEAEGDAGHVPAVLIADPATPSRIAHLAGAGVSPLPTLSRTVARLVAAGAELIVMPSLTSHYYYREVAAAASVPIVDYRAVLLHSIVAYGYRTPLVLATAATRQQRLLLGDEVTLCYPAPQGQHHVDAGIDYIKKGALQAAVAAVAAGIRGALRTGPPCDCILAACTDLSAVVPQLPPRLGDLPLLDGVTLLAEATVAMARRTRQSDPRARRGQASKTRRLGARWEAKLAS